jgi:hypothetical protein
MKLFAEIDATPSRTKLVKFGLVVLVLSIASSAFAWQCGRGHAAVWLASFGVVMFVLALLPKVGRLAYIAWMTLGVAVGRVTSPIVLLVIYVLLVVPIGVALRLRGRDILRRSRDPFVATYWEDYPRAEGVASYLRQS